MGKRSDFERKPRDFYPTPYEAVVPLVPHIQNEKYYTEPCAGDGALIRHLDRHGKKCIKRLDIDPPYLLNINNIGTDAYIDTRDALTLLTCWGTCFITNPPWDRKVLHPLITHLSGLARTWLLLDADWAYTKQSSPFMKHCRSIVAVGRVKWIPDSKMTGKDNCAWYLFDHPDNQITTTFYGR